MERPWHAPKKENEHIQIGTVLVANGYYYRVTFNQMSGLWGQRKKIGCEPWGTGTCKIPADFILSGLFSVQKGVRYCYPEISEFF